MLAERRCARSAGAEGGHRWWKGFGFTSRRGAAPPSRWRSTGRAGAEEGLEPKPPWSHSRPTGHAIWPWLAEPACPGRSKSWDASAATPPRISAHRAQSAPGMRIRSSQGRCAAKLWWWRPAGATLTRRRRARHSRDRRPRTRNRTRLCEQGRNPHAAFGELGGAALGTHEVARIRYFGNELAAGIRLAPRRVAPAGPRVGNPGQELTAVPGPGAAKRWPNRLRPKGGGNRAGQVSYGTFLHTPQSHKSR